jgi:hypothetical protein
VVALCRLALERSRLEFETSALCWSELSAGCMVATLRMSLSWRYTLSAPLTEGVSKVSRSVATAARFWLALAKVGCGGPSRLMAVAMALAQVQALVRSTVMAYSISSVDLRWCNSIRWALMVACSSVSSPYCCAVLHLASTYRAQAHTCCSS